MSQTAFEILLTVIGKLVEQLAARGLVDEREIIDLIVAARREAGH